MAKLEVLTWPNPILKKKSSAVEGVTVELNKFAEDMLETMYDSSGVGLAAPQVGKNIRLIVIDTRPLDERGKVNESEMTELERAVDYPLVMFNPQIVSKVGSIEFEEGCLSVPGFTEYVKRAGTVEVEFLDKHGKRAHLKADGLLGVCVQHEIDHLDGQLFIDRLSTIKSEMIKSKIRKHGYSKPATGHSVL